MVVPSKRTYSRHNMTIVPDDSPSERQEKKQKTNGKVTRQTVSTIPGPIRKPKGIVLSSSRSSESQSPQPTHPKHRSALPGMAARNSYIPKKNIFLPTPPPKRNILGKRIEKDSKEASLWERNQENSPLLRLPGEIRNAIYEQAFGNKTIYVTYETYRTTCKVVNGCKVRDKVIPIFKFHFEIFNKREAHPFLDREIKDSDVSKGMTLLNPVCRQLYEETAVLPHKLNTWAFPSHFVMFDFLVFQKKLTSAQRAAIQVIIIGYQLPSAQVLHYLPGLKKVRLVRERVGGAGLGIGEAPGWYDVVDIGNEKELVKQRK